MAIKFRLKERLIHLFRQPVLLLSVNCGGRRSSPRRKEKKNGKKEIRIRENGKLYMTGEKADQEGRTCPPPSPSHPSKINHHHYYYFKEEQKIRATKQQQQKKKEMMMTPRSKRCELFSSSAMESIDDLGFFSSHEEREEEEEVNKEEDIETFFSSRSFSSDSSDFYQKTKKTKSFSCRPPRRRRGKKRRCIWANGGFQPLVSISRRREEEETEASFAVTKKSRDPYGDFHSSMVEMIVERQIFGAGELQWLLHSYLSLNSVQNHPVILRAFVDISQVLFGY